LDNIVNKIIVDLENVLGMQGSKLVQYYYIGKPKEVDKINLEGGAVFVVPSKSSVVSVTTGLQDITTRSIEIILAKGSRNSVNLNAQKEEDIQYLMRVMDGDDASQQLLSDTIAYVIRNHMRDYGIKQDSLEISFDDNRFGVDEVYTSTMTLLQENIHNQTVI
jgi:hypothetical protein